MPLSLVQKNDIAIKTTTIPLVGMEDLHWSSTCLVGHESPNHDWRATAPTALCDSKVTMHKFCKAILDWLGQWIILQSVMILLMNLLHITVERCSYSFTLNTYSGRKSWTIRDNKTVWVIDTYCRINKIREKPERSVQIHPKRIRNYSMEWTRHNGWFIKGHDQPDY